MEGFDQDANNTMLDMLIQFDAIKYGDFTLTSGLKSKFYVEKFRLLEQPFACHMLVKEAIEKMPMRIKDDETYEFQQIDYVVGMATGGLIVAYEFAKQLRCPAIYIEGKKGCNGNSARKSGPAQFQRLNCG